jgi:hydrogenase expression/formation protein HypC
MCLAVPGLLLDITGSDDWSRMGRVDFGGVVRRVSLACVPEARVGDHVLVHVGMALSVVDAEEAARVFAMLGEMGELAELEPDGAAVASPGARKPPGPSLSPAAPA